MLSSDLLPRIHKKEDESGLHYWRVTGCGSTLGAKAEYDARPQPRPSLEMRS